MKKLINLLILFVLVFALFWCKKQTAKTSNYIYTWSEIPDESIGYFVLSWFWLKFKFWTWEWRYDNWYRITNSWARYYLSKWSISPQDAYFEIYKIWSWESVTWFINFLIAKYGKNPSNCQINANDISQNSFWDKVKYYKIWLNGSLYKTINYIPEAKCDCRKATEKTYYSYYNKLNTYSENQKKLFDIYSQKYNQKRADNMLFDQELSNDCSDYASWKNNTFTYFENGTVVFTPSYENKFSFDSRDWMRLDR